MVRRDPRPFTVGFAAETDGIERAVDKARNKDVDILVYNDVTEPGSGFGTDTNRVVFIGRSGDTEELPLLAKSEVAERLLDRVAADLGEQGLTSLPNEKLVFHLGVGHRRPSRQSRRRDL